jgi:hypothetical protein
MANQTPMFHGHSKNSLENKMFSPSKLFANFHVTLKLWRMIVKFKPWLPQVSTHCCSEIMKKKNACIQDTTFVSQNEKF